MSPEQTDELAIRLARAHYCRTKGDEPPWKSLDDLSRGIAQVWRTMALVVQDVIGIEGAAHGVATMDNIAHAREHVGAQKIRANDKVLLHPMDAVRNAFDAKPEGYDVEAGEWL